MSSAWQAEWRRGAGRLLRSGLRTAASLHPTALRHRLETRKRLRGARPPQARAEALSEAIQWLYRSLDAGPSSGSRCFRVSGGWSACYPEVTGYNLYTLFDHHRATGSRESFERALRMADWLVTVQLASGAYQGGYVDQPPEPTVFNTAQVLQGLVRAYRETLGGAYLSAARRAADWLVAVQDSDGAWRRFCYLGEFRVTDTRVAYPLLEAWKATGEESYRAAAYRSLRLVAKMQHANGWFPQCDNSVELVSQPNTHTIAYTVEGLLESGLLLGDEDLVSAARLCADAMLRRFEIDGSLRGRYDEGWRPTVSWKCLTGCAQTAKNWIRLYEHNRLPYYLNAALKMNDYLCACQDVGTAASGRRGAIPGSEPISGGYQPLSFPSWATKYFCDSLMEEARALASISGAADERSAGGTGGRAS